MATKNVEVTDRATITAASPAAEHPNHTHPKLPADASLEAEIDDRLWRDHDLRTLDLGHIRVQVTDGVAKLTGHVTKAYHRIRAENVALAVPGVKSVVNELVSDDSLKVQVATALAKDPRTRPHILPVGCSHGWILIGGSVPDAETQAAARETAAGVPDVRGVIDLPSIAGQGSVPRDPGHQPEIGWRVYSARGEGRVAGVVIDPCSRLVSHLVVTWNIFQQGRWVEEERVLPMEKVDRVRDSAVWMKPDVDFHTLPDFIPDDYPLAPDGWKPPFPYAPGAVRWPK